MPNYQTRTPEPISVALELGTGDVRIAASDQTDTTSYGDITVHRS